MGGHVLFGVDSERRLIGAHRLRQSLGPSLPAKPVTKPLERSAQIVLRPRPIGRHVPFGADPQRHLKGAHRLRQALGPGLPAKPVTKALQRIAQIGLCHRPLGGHVLFGVDLESRLTGAHRLSQTLGPSLPAKPLPKAPKRVAQIVLRPSPIGGHVLFDVVSEKGTIAFNGFEESAGQTPRLTKPAQSVGRHRPNRWRVEVTRRIRPALGKYPPEINLGIHLAAKRQADHGLKRRALSFRAIDMKLALDPTEVGVLRLPLNEPDNPKGRRDKKQLIPNTKSKGGKFQVFIVVF